MKKIRIAQIGTGHDHASATMITLKLQRDIYDVVGYATVPEDSSQVERFSFEGNKQHYEGVREMTVDEILNCPDLDAVCIETEDRALTKYAILAAERGLHIHMDKPGGVDHEEFERLIDIVKEKKLVFQTGYMYRYNPAVVKLREDIAAGKLGEVYAVEAQMNCIHQPDKRRWLGNYPGGMLYFLGCHMIDMVYSIMGEPEEVIPLNTTVGKDGVNSEDFGMAVLKYKNGVSFAKSVAVEYGGFERRQLVVCGTRGTVELKPFEWGSDTEIEGVFASQTTGVREVLDDKRFENWGIKADCSTSAVHGRYDAMMRAFAEYINGKVNPFGYEYERNLHRLILKACGA